MKTDKSSIQILANISSIKLDEYQKELEAWCGMKFEAFNESSSINHIENIKK